VLRPKEVLEATPSWGEPDRLGGDSACATLTVRTTGTGEVAARMGPATSAATVRDHVCLGDLGVASVKRLGSRRMPAVAVVVRPLPSSPATPFCGSGEHTRLPFGGAAAATTEDDDGIVTTEEPQGIGDQALLDECSGPGGVGIAP